MLITTTFANEFANNWIGAWNDHDMSAIMSHYDDDIVFSSPFILKLGINRDGVISDKSQLQDYFCIALKKYPNLNFLFKELLIGQNSLVLYYESVNELLAAEYMEFDEEGTVRRVIAHYTTTS